MSSAVATPGQRAGGIRGALVSTGAGWVGDGWGGAAAETPLGEQEPTSFPGVPGPLPLTGNKEIMLFLILYLPRTPVIFFLSESNFLLTFLPNVAKHDLCERTLLAACSLPRAPRELPVHSRAARRCPGFPLHLDCSPPPCLLLPVVGREGKCPRAFVDLGFRVLPFTGASAQL